MEKDKKKSITNEQKRVIIPVVAAIGLIAALTYLFHFSMATLNRLERELSEAQRKEKAIGKLQELKMKEKALLQTFRKVSERDDIIKEVAGWARKEGVVIDAIEPTEASIPNTNFVSLTVVLKGKGDYLSLMRFLKTVESAPYFILSSGLELTGYDPKRGRFSSGKSAEELRDSSFKATINVFLAG